jgi:hypothetical protein
MLTTLSVLVVLIVAYAQCREGLFSATTLFVNVLIAGALTFNFWEPLADELDALFAGGILAGYEDALVLTFFFTVFLIVLRVLTNKVVAQQTEFPGYVQQIGGGLVGLLSGYLIAGFLVCVLQTLPWHESFLGFRPRSEDEVGLRKFLPPDRAWLALMRQAGAKTLAWREDRQDAASPYDRYLTFDSAATFELRYLRYRRFGDNREPLRYEGELDRELRKEKPR